MNKTLFKNEFKSLIKPFIIFSIFVLLFTFALISLFPLYKENYDTIYTYLSKLNAPTLRLLSIDLAASTNPLGYYSIVIEYTLVIASLMAVVLSAKAMLWDNINGYNNYLFTKPISRKTIFINKVIVILIQLIIFNILFSVLSILMLKLFVKASLSIITILQINISLILCQITFATISLMISSFIKNPKSIYPISILIILVFYIVSLIEKLIQIAIIRYINPFSYFKISDIVVYGQYQLRFIIASLFIIVFSVSISYRSYQELEIEK